MRVTVRPLRCVYLLVITVAAFVFFGWGPGLLVLAAQVDLTL